MNYGAIVRWLFILLVIGLALWLMSVEAQQPQACVDIDSRQRLRALQLEAIDEAYKESVKHLFEVWMRDPTNQPQRAAVGITSATKAYIHARGAALKWSPPVCP